MPIRRQKTQGDSTQADIKTSSGGQRTKEVLQLPCRSLWVLLKHWNNGFPSTKPHYTCILFGEDGYFFDDEHKNRQPNWELPLLYLWRWRERGGIRGLNYNQREGISRPDWGHTTDKGSIKSEEQWWKATEWWWQGKAARICQWRIQGRIACKKAKISPQPQYGRQRELGQSHLANR